MKSALVVPYRYLGDTLLATPLARSLKLAGYRVEWLVHEGSQGILDGQSFADAVHVLGNGMDATLPMIRKLFGRFDEAFVMNGNDRLTGIGRLAARKLYVTLSEDRFADAWKRMVATAWRPFGEGRHTVYYAEALLKLAGVEPVLDAGIEWNKQDQASALGKAGVVNKPFIHIHPFARLQYKYWPDAHWRKLIEAILKRDLDVVITGSPNDAKNADELAHGLDTERVHPLCGELNWRELAALSAASRLYIGVDTANTHLAAGSGAQVIALFGPTDPRLWGPWPKGHHAPELWQAHTANGVQQHGNVTIIQGRQACVPCQLEGCERHINSRSDCLLSILPEQVDSLMESIINSK